MAEIAVHRRGHHPTVVPTTERPLHRRDHHPTVVPTSGWALRADESHVHGSRDHDDVPAMQHRIDRARSDERHIRQRVGRDVRLARQGAGVSVERAASAVGLSASTFRREFELGQASSATIDQLALACAAVGLVFRRTTISGWSRRPGRRPREAAGSIP